MRRGALPDPGKRHDFRAGSRWRRVRADVLARDGGRCRWCGGDADQVDHVVPASRGGDRYDQANLAASCRGCNASRGARGGRPGQRDREARAQAGERSSCAALYTPRTADTLPPPRGWAPIRGDRTGRGPARGAAG